MLDLELSKISTIKIFKQLYRCLLKNGKSMNLKENIIEHFDYEAISPEVWKYLYSWYSADWCILRYLKKDRINK